MEHLPEKIITVAAIILYVYIIIETIRRWTKAKGEK